MLHNDSDLEFFVVLLVKFFIYIISNDQENRRITEKAKNCKMNLISVVMNLVHIFLMMNI